MDDSDEKCTQMSLGNYVKFHTSEIFIFYQVFYFYFVNFTSSGISLNETWIDDLNFERFAKGQKVQFLVESLIYPKVTI